MASQSIGVSVEGCEATARIGVNGFMFYRMLCDRYLFFSLLVGGFGRGSLAVIGLGAVFAEEVFVEQSRRHRLGAGIEPQGLAGEAGDKLQHRSVVNRVR